MQAHELSTSSCVILFTHFHILHFHEHGCRLGPKAASVIWCRHYSCWQLQCFCEDHSARVGDVRKDFRYTSLPPSCLSSSHCAQTRGWSLFEVLFLLVKIAMTGPRPKMQLYFMSRQWKKMNTWFAPCSCLSPVASHLIYALVWGGV